jgi:hypothetical protein
MVESYFGCWSCCERRLAPLNTTQAAPLAQVHYKWKETCKGIFVWWPLYREVCMGTFVRWFLLGGLYGEVCMVSLV